MLQTSRSQVIRILLLACFMSGAASLFFEVLWTRAFSLILGSTTQATALVFAAFLTGLALGAWLFGRVSTRLRLPLRTYALLEVGIAFTAVATGLLLRDFYGTTRPIPSAISAGSPITIEVKAINLEI
jgi:predicted MFS family arabinose efflux permease